MANAIDITFPVGRLVGGDLYKGSDKDADGNPLVTKTGPNAGQPRLNFFEAVAIPKEAGKQWWETEWGAKIYAHAVNSGAANYVQSPKFAWKIDDGDSTVPNGKGKRNCDREGYPGCWIVRSSSGFPAKLYKWENGQAIPFNEPGAIKKGFFVQVAASIEFNGSAQQPGIYVNHNMICLAGYGQEIYSGPDVESAGFGQAPLPAGASAVPLAGGALPPLPGAAPAPGLPPMPGAVPAPALPPLPAAAPAPVPLPVGLQPVPGAAYTIEALRGQGWTDDQIIAGGYATRPAPTAAPAAPGLPPLPPGFFAAAAPAAAAPAAPAPASITPNVQFVQPPAAAPAPAAAAGLVPVPGAAYTIEGLRGAGWTDDQIVAAGHARRA